MFRIAVCDDDSIFIRQSADLISRWEQKPKNTFLSFFDNGTELINAHKDSPFDIILLDIMMPTINGIETAREIRQDDKNVKIIFLTSSPEFAVESYTVKANGYLLKPVTEKSLFPCLNEFVEEINNSPRTIIVRSIHNVQKLVVDDIVYLEARNKHIIFAMRSGVKIETIEPLHVCEKKLIPNREFFKCHRSYIVNINHIDKYTSKEILMHNGSLIPISRRYQKDFQSAYYTTLFGEVGEDKW